MTTSSIKQENDLKAESMKQEFRNARDGVERSGAQGDGVEKPKDPAHNLNRKDVFSHEAAAAAGLQAEGPSNFLENTPEPEVGLNEELSRGLELGR